MGHFADELNSLTLLAIFMPLIISSGGNSGSQAAPLIIRAMALNEISPKKWWYVMRREIFSGLTLGIILGIIGFIRIAIWQNLHWANYGGPNGEYWYLVAFTVFISLIGVVMWGTISGSMIPILLKSIKLDPATSSAPFVATLVDVTGLVIYFSVAALILRSTLLAPHKTTPITPPQPASSYVAPYQPVERLAMGGSQYSVGTPQFTVGSRQYLYPVV